MVLVLYEDSGPIGSPQGPFAGARSEPKQRSFAKEMIQAMKEKLFGTKSTRTPHFERGKLVAKNA